MLIHLIIMQHPAICNSVTLVMLRLISFKEELEWSNLNSKVISLGDKNCLALIFCKVCDWCFANTLSPASKARFLPLETWGDDLQWIPIADYKYRKPQNCFFKHKSKWKNINLPYSHSNLNFRFQLQCFCFVLYNLWKQGNKTIKTKFCSHWFGI